MDFNATSDGNFARRKRTHSPSPPSHERSGGSASYGAPYSAHRSFGDHNRSRRGPDRPDKRQRRDDSHVSQAASIYQLASRPAFLSLRDFLEFQDAHIEEYEAIKLYAEYKDFYLKVRMMDFFDLHKHEKWFVERYSPTGQQCVHVEVNKMMEICNETFVKDWSNRAFEGMSLEEAATDKETVAETAELDASEGSVPALESDDAQPENKIASKAALILKPWLSDMTNLPRLTLKSVPSSLNRQQLAEAIKKVTAFKAVLLSEISTDRSFARDGWIYLDADADATKVHELFANGMLKVDDACEVAVGFEKPFTTPKIRYAPSIANTEERVRKDYELAMALLRKLANDAQIDIPFVDELIKPISADAASETEISDIKHALDIIIVCLRRVFFFCFYCGLQAECPEDLVRRCGHTHLRKTSCVKNQAFLGEWVHEHEARIAARTLPAAEVRPVSPLLDAAAKSCEKAVRASVVALEEAKFKCSMCTKMFKGPEFVEKHIYLKHVDAIAEFETQALMFKNFIVDAAAVSLAAPLFTHANPATSVSQPPPSNSGSEDRGRRGGRANRRDHVSRSRSRHQDAPREHSGSAPADRRNPYEGRRLRTYADLDAPVLQDVELHY